MKFNLLDEEDGLPINPDKVNGFYRALTTILQSGDNTGICKQMHAEYGRLNTNEQISVASRIQLEWPAEYYMVKKINLTEKEYLKFRLDGLRFSSNGFKFPPGDWLYISSYYGFKKISARYSAIEWQKKYQDGEMLLDILNESLGCKENLVAHAAPTVFTMEAPSKLYGP
ncbi:hypothetical protein [Solilutibacter silvestris]|uniref:hypothetical protein n=1 Tax=Solilutibacter silvestris TaxID=1645665 RepID=UPI003D356652